MGVPNRLSNRPLPVRHVHVPGELVVGRERALVRELCGRQHRGYRALVDGNYLHPEDVFHRIVTGQVAASNRAAAARAGGALL